MPQHPCSLAWVIPVLLTACTQPNWTDSVAAADPMFGSGDAFLFRLRVSPLHQLAGDARERSEFFRQQCEQQDQQARELVQALASEDAAAPALVFLRSDAGNAFVEAELWALGFYVHFGDELPRETAAHFGDRTRVGDVARAEFLHAADTLTNRSGSVGLPQLAMVIAAARLTAEQADEIAAFFASDAGQRWLAIRVQAFVKTRQRFDALRDEACARGFLRSRLSEEDQQDLILPRETYDGTQRR